MSGQKERVLSVKELVLYILSYWKVIVVAMIVGGALLGAFTSLKSKGSNKPTSPIDQLTEEEKAYVDHISELYQRIAPVGSAYSKSYVSTLDPEDVCFTELSYYVYSEGLTDVELGPVIVSDISRAYTQALRSTAFCTRIHNIFNDASISEIPYIIGTDIFDDANIVIVQIRTNTEEENQLLVSEVKKYIAEKKPEIASSFVDHEFVLYNETFTHGSDVGVMSTQTGYGLVVDNQTYNVKVSFQRMTPAQIYKFEQDNGGTLEELFMCRYKDLKLDSYVAPTVVAASSTKGMIKFAIVGGILGAVAVAGVLFLVFIFSNKINNLSEILDYYEADLLGVIPEKKANLFKKAMYKVSNKSDWGYIAKNIVNSAAMEGKQEFTLFSSYYSEEELKNIIKKIKESKINASINAAKGGIATVEGLDSLKNCKNVVFVERANKTLKDDYELELKKSEEYGLTNVGTIVCI